MDELNERIAHLQGQYDLALRGAEESRRSLERLCEDERRLLKEGNLVRHHLHLSHEESIALAKDEEHNRNLLGLVMKCNVFNIAFQISFEDDSFGMINGCRVGMLDGHNIDWFEVNLGIGYVAHAIMAIGTDIGMQYERYKIFPLANCSYIEETASGSTKKYPLCNSSGRIVLWSSEFDSGLIALLDCFKQFMEVVTCRDEGFHFPYRVDGASLLDSTNCRFGIRYYGNKKELWTKAFKLLLTNLKWSFAWLTAHNPE